MIWEVDADQKIVGLSENAIEHLGYHWSDLTGKTLPEIFRNTIQKQVVAWPDWHRPFRDFKVEYNHPDDEVRTFELSSLPVFDDHTGAFRACRGIAKDVTTLALQSRELMEHRLHLEELVEQRTRELEEQAVELQDARNYLDSAIQSFSDGFVLFDADDCFVFANEYFYLAHPETKPIYVPGRSFEDLVRDVAKLGTYGDGPEKVEERVQARMEAYHKGEPYEYRIADGRWFQMNQYKTDNGGTTLVRTNITDIKRKELKLRFRGEVIDGLMQGVQVTRMDDASIIYTNTKFDQMFGYEPGELRGKPVSILNAKTDIDPGQRAEEVVREINETGSWCGEILNVRKDQSVFWCSATVSAFEHPDFGATAISVHTDITGQKELEDRLHRSRRLEAVGRLTSGVAHDFNNLLAIVNGNADWLELKIRPAGEALKSLRSIHQAVKRGAALTNRLLAFSRKQPLSPETTDVVQLLNDLAIILDRTLGDNIELKVMGGTEIWAARVDPNQLEDAVLNLALNSRDAMSGGGCLEISMENVSLDDAYVQSHDDLAAGDYIRVSVRDNGTGMPPDILEKVVEPFFTTKEFGRGSGLGLSMIYGFTKQSKGHFEIGSEPDKGTTVDLYFPRAKDDKRLQVDSVTGSLTAERPGCILVVEDDEMVRNLPVALLRQSGYEVLEAQMGEDAVLILGGDQQIDLLFTDVMLPGSMNGVEIATKARRLQPGIKVLYTSGYADEAFAGADQDMSGEVLLSKPYGRSDLLNQVEKILGKTT
jgi:PAS domain S-box-containing protein